MSYVWIAYSKDPPYLPIAVADTVAELAKLVDTTANNVMSSYSKYLAGRYPSSRFHKVKI